METLPQLAINKIQKTGLVPVEMMPQTGEQALVMLRTLPLQYYNSMTPKCLDDVFRSPTCSIAKFKAETGETKARALIVYILADTVEQYNIGKTMNDLQIARTADLIFTEYYFLKPEDFKLCFNRALTGRYGKVYDRIDAQIIFGWLNQYCMERAEEADNISYGSHSQLKERRTEEVKPIRQIYQKPSWNKKSK